MSNSDVVAQYEYKQHVIDIEQGTRQGDRHNLPFFGSGYTTPKGTIGDTGGCFDTVDEARRAAEIAVDNEIAIDVSATEFEEMFLKLRRSGLSTQQLIAALACAAGETFGIDSELAKSLEAILRI